MNLTTNIFHLARIPDKEPEVFDKTKTLREERDRLADRIYALKREPEFGPGGHTAGWNAALDAALRVIAGGRNTSSS